MRYVFFLYIILIGYQCAPTRFVKPLEKNTHAVGVNIGGPTISFGTPVVLPLSSVYYGYGLDTNLTVFGSLHTTSLLFGNLQTDFGATYGLYNSKSIYIPSFSSSLSGNLVYRPEDNVVRFWPQLDGNAYWKLGKKEHTLYLGISNWFELLAKRSHGQKSIDRWIVNAQIGTNIKIHKWQVQIEGKWLAPNFNSSREFLPYVSISNHGALGFYLGLSRTF